MRNPNADDQRFERLEADLAGTLSRLHGKKVLIVTDYVDSADGVNGFVELGGGKKFDASTFFNCPDMVGYDAVILLGEPDYFSGNADGFLQKYMALPVDSRPEVVVLGHPFYTEDVVKDAVAEGLFAGQVVDNGQGTDIDEVLSLIADRLTLKGKIDEPRNPERFSNVKICVLDPRGVNSSSAVDALSMFLFDGASGRIGYKDYNNGISPSFPDLSGYDVVLFNSSDVTDYSDLIGRIRGQGVQCVILYAHWPKQTSGTDPKLFDGVVSRDDVGGDSRLLRQIIVEKFNLPS